MDILKDVFSNNNAVEVLMKMTNKTESEVFEEVNDVLFNFPNIARNYVQEARFEAVKQAIFEIYPQLTIDQQRKALDIRMV